jgi:hypothetical protein
MKKEAAYSSENLVYIHKTRPKRRLYSDIRLKNLHKFFKYSKPMCTDIE